MRTPTPLPRPTQNTCPQCGTGWDGDSATCPRCGAELKIPQPRLVRQRGLWVLGSLPFGIIGSLTFYAGVTYKMPSVAGDVRWIFFAVSIPCLLIFIWCIVALSGIRQ